MTHAITAFYDTALGFTSRKLYFSPDALIAAQASNASASISTMAFGSTKLLTFTNVMAGKFLPSAAV